jgi:hypothetical protein
MEREGGCSSLDRTSQRGSALYGKDFMNLMSEVVGGMNNLNHNASTHCCAECGINGGIGL